MNNKQINIDFLYLDLNICERCIATGNTLDGALKMLTPIFEVLGYSVKVNKVNITTEKLAVQHRFVSSPTIRVNGIDICNELRESECENCGNLAGCSVDCRVFVYEGKEHTQPPTAEIADGILQVLYGNMQKKKNNYTLPNNLKKYFIGREKIMKAPKIEIYEKALCCETGVCGANVDTELLRITSLTTELKSKGISIERYNLSSRPDQFVKNKFVSDYIKTKGIEILPLTLADGKIIKEKAYPTNTEIEKLTGIKISDCGCGDVNCGCGTTCDCTPQKNCGCDCDTSNKSKKSKKGGCC